MNWVDLVIIGALLFFALEALGRPLILEILDLLSFLIAFFISFSLYNLPASFFETEFKIPHGLSLVLGFMAIWFISEALFYLLVRIILPGIPPFKKALDVFSVVPAVLRGLVFISLTLVLIATFPIQPGLKKAVLESEIGSRILKNAYQLEQPVKNVFGGVSNDTLTFLTIKPKTSGKVNLGFQTSQHSVDSESEKIMIELVNKERTSRGVAALVFDAALRDVGRAHSGDMFKRGYFSHFSPEGKSVADRISGAGIDFLVVGENLAFAPDVPLAHKGLMNSEGHKANILSADYTKVGIGVIDGGVYGKMFTQIFTNEATSSAALGFEGQKALVSKVVDGDTIQIEGGQTIRFLGIDTPETVDPRRPVGCFGREASNETKSLLSGKVVFLQKDVSDTDKYKRLLRYIYLPLQNGQELFVNDYLVREGFAKVLTYPPDVKYNEQLRQAEREAKGQKRGLWGKC